MNLAAWLLLSGGMTILAALALRRWWRLEKLERERQDAERLDEQRRAMERLKKRSERTRKRGK